MIRVRRILSTGPLNVGLTLGAALIAVSFSAACDSGGGSGTPLSPSAAATSASSPSKQGRPSNAVPATITFADAAGDAITSNGSPYAAEILSGNALEFTCCTGQIVNYNFNAVISGTGPTGTASYASDVQVNNVGSMAIGSTILTRAFFKTPIGQINFDSTLDAQTNSVSVTRVSATTWAVNTSAGDVGVLVQTQTIPDPNHPHKTITVTTKTYYHLGFSFTGVTQ